MLLTLSAGGNHSYTASLDGREVLRAKAFAIRGDARARDQGARAGRASGTRRIWTRFDWAEVTGEAPEAALRGYVLAGTASPVEGASVHVAGFDDLFTLTDARGEYRLPRVPRGERVVVAAAEGTLFARGVLL